MPDKPWLGAQEAQYASLLWHLDVPNDYTSQIDATRSVFPGKALVNVDQSPIDHAQVTIKGFAKAWITDMECATSFRPKMYGFDFARVTEVFLDNTGKKRLVAEKTPAQRAALPELSGERAMMKDLMLSTMREGGEVSLTYHMLNPFLPAQNDVQGDRVGEMLGFAPGGAGNLGAVNLVTDMTADVVAARNIVKAKARLLGKFIDEVLKDANSNGKNIWLRLLHEPNANFFWWGHPSSGGSNNFYQNYTELWNFLVSEIKKELKEGRESRLKLVFCINGESSLAGLNSRLAKYFPETGTRSASPDYRTFLGNIDILGLDYYEDWAKEWRNSGLPDQYEAVALKTEAMKTTFRLSWEHALTEVSVRTKGANRGKTKGKLYGEYDGAPAWSRFFMFGASPIYNRQFFDRIVYRLVADHQPKWVLFWVNRVGNSILSSFEPTTATTPTGTPAVYYHSGTNVFSDDNVEHYFPIFPAEPFVIETFKAGDSSGTKDLFPISSTEQLPNLPGATATGAWAKHRSPYKDAIVDFFQMVPPTRRTANTLKLLEAEQFRKDPTKPRPVVDPSATPAQQAEMLFEVL